jgi:hypothetical protein
MERIMVHIGKHNHRLGDKLNIEELEFAKAWQKINDQGNILEYLMSKDNRPREANGDQIEIAATVVQWLGSHVGQSFLRDLGYTKNRK